MSRRGVEFSHVCRDGHTTIGHNDSEHEMCPLCIALARLEALQDRALGVPLSEIQHLLDKWTARAAQWSALELRQAESEVLFCIDDLRTALRRGGSSV